MANDEFTYRSHLHQLVNTHGARLTRADVLYSIQLFSAICFNRALDQYPSRSRIATAVDDGYNDHVVDMQTGSGRLQGQILETYRCPIHGAYKVCFDDFHGYNDGGEFVGCPDCDTESL